MTDPERDPEADDRRRTMSLAALAVVLGLVVVGLWLSHALRHQSAQEDCLLSGRTNCARIDPATLQR